MLMPDVNILIHAHREDAAGYEAYGEWLQQAIETGAGITLSVLAATGFIRVVTRPQFPNGPTPLAVALANIEELVRHPRCRVAAPGPAHLDEVIRLCRLTDTSGGSVTDAEHAALAIAEGATWVTRDAGFARFADHGLRWQHLVLD
jgi:uncharacterized protein